MTLQHFRFGAFTATGVVLALASLAPAVAEDKTLVSLQMRGVATKEVPVDMKAVAGRLSKAITYPTISNQDRADFNEQAFRDFHRFLEQAFPLTHKALVREVVGKPRVFTLLYTWKGKEPSLAPVVLMGHQDVVPVVPGTEGQWQHGAFSGDIADGYIWGRGSLDDKVMIMAIFESIEKLLQQGFQPKRSVILAFGQDEEVGGAEGMQIVVEALQARGIKHVAIALDEGVPLAKGLFPGIENPLALIGTTEKGYLSLQLEVAGVGGHSAMPPRNSNIGILARAITRLEDNPFPIRITSALRDQFRFLGPELPKSYHRVLTDIAFGGQAAQANAAATQDNGQSLTQGFTGSNASEDQFIKMMLSSPQTEAMLRTTTAVTMVNGGIKDNILPPIATAIVNFRILQGETVQSVTDRVKKVIDDERVAVTNNLASNDPTPVSGTAGPEYQLLEKSIRQTWGTPDLLVAPYLVVGGADAKWFASSIAPNTYRFTAVRVESVADVDRWHGVNERVLLTEYARSIGFYYHFLNNAQGL